MEKIEITKYEPCDLSTKISLNDLKLLIESFEQQGFTHIEIEEDHIGYEYYYSFKLYRLETDEEFENRKIAKEHSDAYEERRLAYFKFKNEHFNV